MALPWTKLKTMTAKEYEQSVQTAQKSQDEQSAWEQSLRFQVDEAQFRHGHLPTLDGSDE